MSVAARSVYQLVDGVLDEGLPFVGSYLEKMLNRPVIITDSIGQVYYPDMPGGIAGIDEMFIRLPADRFADESYYQESERRLYYHIELNGASANIIVNDLPAELVAKTESVLAEGKLAIKCYFSKLKSTNKKKDRFAEELAEYLISKNNADIKEVIRLSDKDLDIQKPYIVEIINVEETVDTMQWELINSYVREYQGRRGHDAISFVYSDCLVLVIPASCNGGTGEVIQDWLPLHDIIRFKEAVENRFNISVSIGQGQVHQLAQLKKSYEEARYALTLQQLMGKKSFIQRFSDLGVFSFVFSQDPKTLENYCQKTLGQLMEYDRKNNGQLLDTLRKLLACRTNTRAVAESLFIHINTLYYRMEKIEKLLNVELSQKYTRLDLFAAVTVWDTLKMNGFID